MIKQKILQVHNYYQLPGGEDTVVANEKQLLEDNGHTVVLYTRHNAELKEMGFFRKLLLPLSTIFNFRTYRDIKRIIQTEKIDIVHVHNTLNLVSPAVYYAAVGCGVPVVQTVHNFRLLCPAATFYHDGRICEDCLTKGLGCALRNKCYRGSRIQTLACVLNMLVHRATGILGNIHYICLTEFNKEKLLSLKCIPEEHVHIKPNFVNSYHPVVPANMRKNRMIFVGRLEHLKGVDLLLEAWRLLGENAPELVMCGTGPLEQWCRDFIAEHNLHTVTLRGFVPNEEVRQLIGESRALIMPTQCYETFGMTIIEAYAGGVPVLTGNMGNCGNLVEESVTGLHFQYNDAASLARAVCRFQKENTITWAENACLRYEAQYTPQANYAALCDVYETVMHKE